MNELVRSSVESISNLLEKSDSTTLQGQSKSRISRRRLSDTQAKTSGAKASEQVKLDYSAKGANSSMIMAPLEDFS